MTPHIVKLLVVHFHKHVHKEHQQYAQLDANKRIARVDMAKKGSIHEHIGQQQQKCPPYIVGLDIVHCFQYGGHIFFLHIQAWGLVVQSVEQMFACYLEALRFGLVGDLAFCLLYYVDVCPLFWLVFVTLGCGLLGTSYWSAIYHICMQYIKYSYHFDTN